MYITQTRFHTPCITVILAPIQELKDECIFFLCQAVYIKSKNKKSWGESENQWSERN